MNNYFNKALLWLFLLPKGVYKRLNVDIFHLRAILIIKLTMDDRTVTGINKARSRGSKEDASMATMFTVAMSLVMGLAFLVVFWMSDDVTRMTFYFASFGFMLAMFLVTDFSHILLDTRDNYIILPKPVTSATFLVGRLLHIVIHLLKILLPMALPGFIAIWISRGVLGALVFIPVLVLLAIFTFAIVNALYLLIMRSFSIQKINSIITTMQIAFTALMYGSFQILPRMLDMNDIENIHIGDSVFVWLFPGYWFGCAWKLIYSFSLESTLILGTILSIAVPVLSAWIMVKYLAPSFIQKLSMMSGSGIEPEEVKKGAITRKGSSSQLLGFFSRLFTSNDVERQSFLFVGRMVSRNRDFKLKVYPVFGYLIILFVMLMFTFWEEIDPSHVDIHTSALKTPFLMTVYLSCMICVTALYQLPYSEQYKSAWIYYVPPLERPGIILRGALKVCMVKFVLPLVFLISFLSIGLVGVEILPNLIFGFGSVFLGIILYAWVLLVRLPFSFPLKNTAEGNFSIRNMFMLIILPIFGIPQYFLFEYSWVLWILSAVVITAALIGLRYMSGIQWSHLKEG